jgi:hypothetical protein
MSWQQHVTMKRVCPVCGQQAQLFSTKEQVKVKTSWIAGKATIKITSPITTRAHDESAHVNALRTQQPQFAYKGCTYCSIGPFVHSDDATLTQRSASTG